MKYYLYNPKANNGIKKEMSEGCKLVDATSIDYPEFFYGLKPEDEVVMIGGDGTLNYLVNHVDIEKVSNNIYLLANGTGNDFLNDINEKVGKEILINKYLTNLPTVKVNGISAKFINGMGYGIDGYCCETADKIKEKEPNKKLNYTAIAIKGLLFFFKPCHATIEVDGQKYEYDDVWLAPTMKGRFYGGGMKVAPAQDRFEDKLTCVVYKSKCKIKALMNFPKIFEGKHIENTEMVKVHEGKKFHITYSRPCAAQIDGNTVLNVSEYWAEM